MGAPSRAAPAPAMTAPSGVGGLRENGQEAGRSPAHVVGCQHLHNRAANRDADRVADAENAESDKSHPKPWRQAKKSQAERERESGNDRERAFAFDIAGGEYKPDPTNAPIAGAA